jgi:hypothetical protein
MLDSDALDVLVKSIGCKIQVNVVAHVFVALRSLSCRDDDIRTKKHRLNAFDISTMHSIDEIRERRLSLPCGFHVTIGLAVDGCSANDADEHACDYLIHPYWSNVCDEGQNPFGGVLYLQRLVGIRMFSLLFSKTNPNRPFEPPPFSDLPTATCATSAVPDTLSGRLAARSRAAVAASNRPISILFQRLR